MTCNANCQCCKGACCCGSQCTQETCQDCEAAYGTWAGPGTQCGSPSCAQPTGACCGEACAILSECECLQAGGVYQGDNTTCSPDPCAGCSGSCDEENPCPEGCQCVDGACVAPDPCQTETGTIYQLLSSCQRIDAIQTITNDFDAPAYFSISGSVDDDVVIDGEIYQEGQFAFPWGWYGAPCESTNSTNGAHSFSFSKTLQPGESVQIGGKDNGFAGGLTASWTLSTCEDPPPVTGLMANYRSPYGDGECQSEAGNPLP